MKERIGVVTDSGSMIKPEEAERLGVKVVPLVIIYGGENLNDHQITAAELKQKVTRLENLTTSAPPPGEFILAYNQQLDLGVEQIISIHVAKGIRPGTIQSAEAAASQMEQEQNLAENTITVFDSKQVAFAIGFLVREAVELLRSGENFSTTLAKLEEIRPKLNTIGTISDFRWVKKTIDMPELLKKMGIPEKLRNSIQIILNNPVMKLSPLIQIVNGGWKLRPVAVPRRRIAPRRLAEVAVSSTPGKIRRAGIFHFDAPNQAAETAFHFEQLTGTKPDIAEVPASFAAGAGPGAYGICLLGK